MKEKVKREENTIGRFTNWLDTTERFLEIKLKLLDAVAQTILEGSEEKGKNNI